MPKVTLGRFTEKDKRFIKNIRAGLLKKEKNANDLAAKSGTCSKTVYNRYEKPANMTVKELRAYIKESGVSQEEVIDFLFEGN